MCAPDYTLQMTRNENVTDESWFTSLIPLTHISAESTLPSINLEHIVNPAEVESSNGTVFGSNLIERLH